MLSDEKYGYFELHVDTRSNGNIDTGIYIRDATRQEVATHSDRIVLPNWCFVTAQEWGCAGKENPSDPSTSIPRNRKQP
ncbi:MAG: hypothetical protein GY758_19850 [Fuerstiella sp.]|nr:hypothetical protein [Fuerstiella sp.]MCP4783741.1 hypothetical protein [Fuerstiella sp.]MCP4857024.1 hypothetical protein [Fuerstiella sp.]